MSILLAAPKNSGFEGVELERGTKVPEIIPKLNRPKTSPARELCEDSLKQEHNLFNRYRKLKLHTKTSLLYTIGLVILYLAYRKGRGR